MLLCFSTSCGPFGLFDIWIHIRKSSGTLWRSQIFILTKALRCTSKTSSLARHVDCSAVSGRVVACVPESTGEMHTDFVRMESWDGMASRPLRFRPLGPLFLQCRGHGRCGLLYGFAFAPRSMLLKNFALASDLFWLDLCLFVDELRLISSIWVYNRAIVCLGSQSPTLDALEF